MTPTADRPQTRGGMNPGSWSNGKLNLDIEGLNLPHLSPATAWAWQMYWHNAQAQAQSSPYSHYANYANNNGGYNGNMYYQYPQNYGTGYTVYPPNNTGFGTREATVGITEETCTEDEGDAPEGRGVTQPLVPVGGRKRRKKGGNRNGNGAVNGNGNANVNRVLASPARVGGPSSALAITTPADVTRVLSPTDTSITSITAAAAASAALQRYMPPASPPPAHSQQYFSPPPNIATSTLLRNASFNHSSVSAKGTTQRHRPAHWRASYVPPSSAWIRKKYLHFKAFLTDDGSRFSAPYGAPSGTPFHRSLILNPLLSLPSPPPPTYYYDLRSSPFSAYLLHLPTSNGPITDLHLLQLATTPPIHQLHLYHPKLPWPILVKSGNPNGLLISDVLSGIYSSLMQPITLADYYNAEMTAEDREQIEGAYRVRCRGDLGMLKGGVRRVDWLGEDVGFVGLEMPRWGGGMWEVRTVRVGEGMDV
ncbi:hypothetical protein FA15DRAFT_154143 [Coprinopsis marcescibilis]|uniref:DUF6699 domain-containing protein n=1 Tax=Coprinopsis marcescibilis TaxID=230819 RepID=A0A5C3KI71_COPMA|nr:hypothetical protein FA15DRAFT_154143 [Coprinopsis marcescibilis]